MSKLISIVLLYFFCSISCFAQTQFDQSLWINQADPHQPILRVDLFLSTTCPYCAKASQYMDELSKQLPWLEIHRYAVNQDTNALNLFYQRLKSVDDMNFALPGIFFCATHWVGFSQETPNAQELLCGLMYCHDRVVSQGALTASTVRVLNAWSKANQWRLVVDTEHSPLVFISSLAFFDFVMPCSLFALFLILVWLGSAASVQALNQGGSNIGKKEYASSIVSKVHFKMTFILFLTYLIAHYIGQVHSEIYLEHLSSLRPLAFIFSGLWFLLIIDWIRQIKKTKSIAITIRFAPLLAVLSLIFVLAFQQNCASNVSLVFQQWLNHQDISIKTYWAYQLLYQFIACLPLLLLCFTYTYFLRSKKMQSKEVILCCFNILFMLASALLLMFAPESLSQSWLAWLFVFFIALLLIICLRFLVFFKELNIKSKS